MRLLIALLTRRRQQQRRDGGRAISGAHNIVLNDRSRSLAVRNAVWQFCIYGFRAANNFNRKLVVLCVGKLQLFALVVAKRVTLHTRD